MKIITIGRDTDNDIQVSDSKASRHHVQIISNGGEFRIVDLNSSNGTFVNNFKINHETVLQANDIVRVGNTVLPWQTYFRDGKKPNSRLWIATAAAVVLALIIGIYFLSKQSADKTPDKQIVKMHEKNGVRCIPVKINGQELDFVFDTGAGSICISTLEALVLVKNGTLVENDVIGSDPFMDASGNVSVGTRINLKTVQIGDRTLRNIEATVIENPNAVCLLGQTVLSRFGKYTIDNQRGEIIFE
ncbi:MAG: FHA domain-containing protein [Tannerella sp.]|jgi:aspartyl protease family protein|nr:FHA domain-containing protein [Tannerella sp.]